MVFDEKQLLKEELRKAVEKGVREMLNGVRGAHYFGSQVRVTPYEKLLEVEVPGEPRSTFFEVVVKERRK